MKINITNKEYRLLLDVMAIADFVILAHRTGKDPRTELMRCFFKRSIHSRRNSDVSI